MNVVNLHPSSLSSPSGGHHYRQNVFQGEFDTTPTPNTQISLPSGVGVLGIGSWVKKFADVA